MLVERSSSQPSLSSSRPQAANLLPPPNWEGLKATAKHAFDNYKYYGAPKPHGGVRIVHLLLGSLVGYTGYILGKNASSNPLKASSNGFILGVALFALTLLGLHKTLVPEAPGQTFADFSRRIDENISNQDALVGIFREVIATQNNDYLAALLCERKNTYSNDDTDATFLHAACERQFVQVFDLLATETPAMLAEGLKEQRSKDYLANVLFAEYHNLYPTNTSGQGLGAVYLTIAEKALYILESTPSCGFPSLDCFNGRGVRKDWKPLGDDFQNRIANRGELEAKTN